MPVSPVETKSCHIAYNAAPTPTEFVDDDEWAKINQMFFIVLLNQMSCDY